MKALEEKMIVYDSNCRVCTSLRSLILLITSIPAAKTVAYEALPSDLQVKVDIGRFRNEMALIDKGKQHTLYGADGVMVIFSACWSWFSVLMKLSLFRFLFRHLYKIIAFNRYVIAPPKNRISCDCYPETNIRYRLAYIVLCVSGAVTITGLFGASVSRIFNSAALAGAWHMLLIAGTGWLLQYLMAYFIAGNKYSDYAGHLASVMFTGVLPLLIAIFTMPLLNIPAAGIPIVSVSISFPLMLFMHFRRVAFLGASQWLTFSWVLSLITTAIFWIKMLGYATT